AQPPDPRNGWEVLHAGALYYGRSLSSFLEAAARLVDADPEFARDFRLTLTGSLDASASAELRRTPLGDHVDVSGQRDHASTICAPPEAAVARFSRCLMTGYLACIFDQVVGGAARRS